MNGEVTIRRVSDSGEMSTLVDGSNRIMTVSKARLISAITWPDTTHSWLVDPVVELRFGSGGEELGEPKIVSGLEEDLHTPILAGYDSTDIYHNRPLKDLSKKTITYGYTLDLSELIGSNISEVGLFTQSGMLFAMKTFDEIPKDGTFALVITWSIGIL